MKQTFSKLLFCAAVFGSLFANGKSYWTPTNASLAPTQLQRQHPNNFLVYRLDEAAVKFELWNLSEAPEEGVVMSLPMADGSYRDFKVWQSSMMPEQLANKYPDIRTFTGEAVDDRRVTAKIDFTLFGFHAMIFDGDNTSFIDPYDNMRDGFYMVHYKKDEQRLFSERMHCEMKTENDKTAFGQEPMMMEKTDLPKLAARVFNGHNLRTYRLALSADNQYCRAATGLPTPTIAQALSAMTTTMNRINGVYNRDFSVQMNFCANEDTLIWTAATGTINGTDPFNAINSNAGSCLTANQTQCTNRIGSANYDLGHVFTTGAGGLSSLGVVCNNTQKAKSVTGSPSPVGDGFDIDYVAHEMGHEFGSEHTFNNNTDGSCGGNAVSTAAYEPGSGSTIMAYAGICSPDDLVAHSDAYFCASSLKQIQAKLAGSENVCAVITSTGNKLVYLDPFSANYTIPYKTPFELLGPTAVDSVADTANLYCWEQANLGDFNKRFSATYKNGPIFRSYNPAYTPLRVFPKVSMVVSGVLSNAGIENAQGEKVPDTARYLTFKMTVRNIMNGKGCFLTPDDTIHLNVISTGSANGFAGFKVTSQGTTGISYLGGTSQTITWNVVGTNAAPVNATNVDIYMSTDGGYTWPYYMGSYPNTGTAAVFVPNPPTTSISARFKVKGAGNVFFNINSKNFAVTHNSSLPLASSALVSLTDAISIFPIPATDAVHFTTTYVAPLQTVIYNAIGQSVWNGTITNSSDIAVSAWAKGVYYARFTDAATGQNAVKSFVVQ